MNIAFGLAQQTLSTAVQVGKGIYDYKESQAAIEAKNESVEKQEQVEQAVRNGEYGDLSTDEGLEKAQAEVAELYSQDNFSSMDFFGIPSARVEQIRKTGLATAEFYLRDASNQARVQRTLAAADKRANQMAADLVDAGDVKSLESNIALLNYSGGEDGDEALNPYPESMPEPRRRWAARAAAGFVDATIQGRILDKDFKGARDVVASKVARDHLRGGAVAQWEMRVEVAEREWKEEQRQEARRASEALYDVLALRIKREVGLGEAPPLLESPMSVGYIDSLVRDGRLQGDHAMKLSDSLSKILSRQLREQAELAAGEQLLDGGRFPQGRETQERYEEALARRLEQAPMPHEKDAILVDAVRKSGYLSESLKGVLKGVYATEPPAVTRAGELYRALKQGAGHMLAQLPDDLVAELERVEFAGSGGGLDMQMLDKLRGSRLSVRDAKELVSQRVEAGDVDVEEDIIAATELGFFGSLGAWGDAASAWVGDVTGNRFGSTSDEPSDRTRFQAGLSSGSFLGVPKEQAPVPMAAKEDYLRFLAMATSRHPDSEGLAREQAKTLFARNWTWEIRGQRLHLVQHAPELSLVREFGLSPEGSRQVMRELARNVAREQLEVLRAVGDIEAEDVERLAANSWLERNQLVPGEFILMHGDMLDRNMLSDILNFSLTQTDAEHDVWDDLEHSMLRFPRLLGRWIQGSDVSLSYDGPIYKNGEPIVFRLTREAVQAQDAYRNSMRRMQDRQEAERREKARWLYEQDPESEFSQRHFGEAFQAEGGNTLWHSGPESFIAGSVARALGGKVLRTKGLTDKDIIEGRSELLDEGGLHQVEVARRKAAWAAAQAQRGEPVGGRAYRRDDLLNRLGERARREEGGESQEEPWW